MNNDQIGALNKLSGKRKTRGLRQGWQKEGQSRRRKEEKQKENKIHRYENNISLPFTKLK